MKKFFTTIISLALACFLLLTAASCTREYTCKCKISYSGVPGLPKPDTREYSIKDTKENARSLCADNSKTYVKNGIQTIEDCQLW